ncbi:calmodulin-binding transcription activator 1-like isoform X2 [Spea bombifrons]|uniref:calmodulin-binding transcription activator 1-like isoform X2 n=1 Tax=Spea bombifrons TaxID=233779 RepID=UPI0023495887|nr:calmodulin-binding transcription activator 1-like isoform X2 [Spea bombifrons]
MNTKECAEVSENTHQIKVFLPKKLLECLPKCPVLPKERHRWNTNEEIASYLITFEKHEEWLSSAPKTRPQNGSIILYNRKKVKYRKDGYCWKKRKDGKTTREDHMKLKVQGMECLYGCYVHSSIVPTFHRRCYWLLQNPDIVLVHYLNVPAIEDCGKICGPILCSTNSDRKEWMKWSKEDLINQLRPMFHGIKWSCSNGNGTSEFSIEQLVQQILDTHQAKPPPRTHACLCSTNLGSSGGVPHKCSSTKHRIISPKVEPRLCSFPALTEVQNISSSSAEPDHGKERRGGHKGSRTPTGSDPGSSRSFPDLPDSTQASPPLALTNGFYAERELTGVTITTTPGVPGISAVLVMTGIPEKPLALTPSQHLMPAEAGSQPTAVPVGISLLPSPVEGLLLSSSQSLEVTMEAAAGGTGAFDPDSFLNSPKEGQTYGGAAGRREFKTEAAEGGTAELVPHAGGAAESGELAPCAEEEKPSTSRPGDDEVKEEGGPGSEVDMDTREEAAAGEPQAEVVSTANAQEEAETPATHMSDLYSIIQSDLSSSAMRSDLSSSVMQSDLSSSAMQSDLSSSVMQSDLSSSVMQSDLSSSVMRSDLSSSVMQSDLSSSSGASSVHMELSTENFNISFDSHFPDLISDLMTEESAPTAYEPYGEPQARSSPADAGYLQQPVQPMGAPATFTDAGDASVPLVGITDFSPEWSYPEGGVKILITGPWVEDTDSYSCVFDHVTVPASLIQSGVLRCYCPAHEAGLVTLQVVQHQQIISHSVIFEYRARNFLSLPSTQLDWLSLDDNQFRMSILERLEQMERRMADMSSSHLQTSQPPQSTYRGSETTQTSSGDSFESRLVAICEKMMSQTCWVTSDLLAHEMSFRGMTLLHLAAAQGYARLIETLIQWRSLHSQSLAVELEVDPLNVDHFSCTPLMWACALGHTEAASLLFRWDCRALSIPDSLGRLPLGVARSRGHVKLAATLEELQRQESVAGNYTDLHGASWHSLLGNHDTSRGLSPLSTSADTGLSSLPSPSDVSDGSVSVTSAYSSSSALRGSPDFSPESSQDAPAEMPPSPPILGTSSWDLGDAEGAALFLDSPGMEADYGEDAALLEYREDTENQRYLQVDMVTLAEQIIEATPERIKKEDFAASDSGPLRERPSNLSKTMAWLASYLDTADKMPGLPPHGEGIRAARALARFAQMSPGDDGSSHGCHPDTGPFVQRSKRGSRRCAENLRVKVTRSEAPPSTPPPLGEISFERFEPPGTARWSEFLSASSSGRMESEFALLTLSDHEQRELYEAARVIQTAFRKYKGRRLKEQQDLAAAVIQRCYRKYKQYALYKKMTQAAILIQSKFRSYYEQKRFQQSRRAAVLIQQCYRSYREGARGGLQHRIKGSFLTKKQDQAARKIMRFLRRCRHRMKELKQTQDLECLQKRGLTN